MTADLTARLAAIPGVGVGRLSQPRPVGAGPALDVEAMADAMAELGIRLATITAIPRSVTGETTIIYHFITAATSSASRRNPQRGVASLAGRSRAAAWAEREIRICSRSISPAIPTAAAAQAQRFRRRHDARGDVRAGRAGELAHLRAAGK